MTKIGAVAAGEDVLRAHVLHMAPPELPFIRMDTLLGDHGHYPNTSEGMEEHRHGGSEGNLAIPPEMITVLAG